MDIFSRRVSQMGARSYAEFCEHLRDIQRKSARDGAGEMVVVMSEVSTN